MRAGLHTHLAHLSGLLLAVCLVFFSAGCTIDDDGDDDDYYNASLPIGVWQLQRMPGVSPADLYRGFTLRITPDNLSGYAYNSFSAKARISKGVLAVASHFTTSRKGVFGIRGKVEKTYFRRLKHARQWQRVGRKLIIDGAAGRLVFLPKY